MIHGTNPARIGDLSAVIPSICVRILQNPHIVDEWIPFHSFLLRGMWFNSISRDSILNKKISITFGTCGRDRKKKKTSGNQRSDWMADDDDGQEGIIPARLLRQNYFFYILPNIRPTSDSSEGKKTTAHHRATHTKVETRKVRMKSVGYNIDWRFFFSSWKKNSNCSFIELPVLCVYVWIKMAVFWGKQKL